MERWQAVEDGALWTFHVVPLNEVARTKLPLPETMTETKYIDFTLAL